MRVAHRLVVCLVAGASALEHLGGRAELMGAVMRDLVGRRRRLCTLRAAPVDKVVLPVVAGGAADPASSASLARDAVPLVACANVGEAIEALRRDGVAKLCGVVDPAVCDRLRRRIVEDSDAFDSGGRTDVAGDARFSSRARVRFGDAMRVSFAGARSDVLLPLDDAAVRTAVGRVATALEEVLRGGVEGRLAYDAAEHDEVEVEVVECAALVARRGAGHQALHSDFVADVPNPRARLPPRLVVFLALDPVPATAHGATVFCLADESKRCSTPLAAGDVVIYDAALPHFGAAKAEGDAARAVFYSSWARAASADSRARSDAEAQARMGEFDGRAFEAVRPPTLAEVARSVETSTLGQLAEAGCLSMLRFRGVDVGPDDHGGLGVFAIGPIPRGTELAHVPLDQCIFAPEAAQFARPRGVLP